VLERVVWQLIPARLSPIQGSARNKHLDAPTIELDETFWRNAEILDPRHEKSTITMRVDEDVLSFFKGGGSGYQSRMNAVLRAYVYARREKATQGPL